MSTMSPKQWTWVDAEVVEVVDGDTVSFKVTRDIGFGGTATFIVRLRLNRINAAPKGTIAGIAATAYLKTLLVIGALVSATTMKPYKYGGPDTSPGEWMVEVTLADGTNVSDLMVATGNAVYWDGQGPRPGG